MYYHRARYYSQSLRRFIREDPVEGSTSPWMPTCMARRSRRLIPAG